MVNKQWYFVTKIVLILWEKIVPVKFEAEGREFENFLGSLDQFIQTVKGQNNFWSQNDFLTCS